LLTNTVILHFWMIPGTILTQLNAKQCLRYSYINGD
jgi:hypothetical protein